MGDRVRIQIDITPEIEEKIIRCATKKGLKKNNWLKLIIYNACENELKA